MKKVLEMLELRGESLGTFTITKSFFELKGVNIWKTSVSKMPTTPAVISQDDICIENDEIR